MLKTRVERLRDRGAMLTAARAFFASKGILEVDCPILSKGVAIDVNIDLVAAMYAGKERCYLHSSPEYGMKRLLAEGVGDIYQLSHVFRDGEVGSRHNPEFMMAEWYRTGFTFQEMIDETLDFVRVFVGDLPSTIISYRDAIKHYAGIDYVTATDDDLRHYLADKGTDAKGEERDNLLNYILGISVEPHLGSEGLTALAYYPATQAALARTKWHGDEPVAERFEVYYRGVELANGYHELADAKEQKQRFITDNAQRKALGKEVLPIDEEFLKALEHGFPDCCGVAVGFDRLMMLRHGSSQIADVIPFAWTG